MEGQTLKPAALRMLAWGCLWSPLAETADHQDAWALLGLPGAYEDARIEYWNTFHAGMPQPPVPLLIHALLQLDGAGLREDLMRVASYLDVEWSEHRLPPDHLGPVCELYGLAVEREEPVLIEGLRARFLAPWTAAAITALTAHPAMANLVRRFADDL